MGRTLRLGFKPRYCGYGLSRSLIDTIVPEQPQQYSAHQRPGTFKRNTRGP